MMRAIVAGPDADGLGAALTDEGVETTHVEGIATRTALEDADAADVDLFVLTDVGQATAIPIVRELNGSLRVVVYDHESIPEFARGQADLILDPDLLGPDAVAEELAAE